MTASSIAESISPRLLKVRERAKDPSYVFRGLAHLIDEAALARAHGRLRKDAAVGVDGITVEQYGLRLESNIRDLHVRMRTMRWRHAPIRRVNIPKDGGRTRPIGISCTEDKIVQEALRELLEAVYEPIFRDCSYGCRPGRSPHDALRALNRVLVQGKVSTILEADIKSYFDSIDRKKLMELLQGRVSDGSFRRLVGKCLHVGVLEGTEYSEPEDGTVQGSVLSPLLGNVYLHHVLDVWFEQEVQPRLAGKAFLIRYVDDFVIAFEEETDAWRVKEMLRERFEAYGLTLHPEKTRVLSVRGPDDPDSDGKDPASFDFLGFTHYWRRTRGGSWKPWLKTRTARLRKAIKAASDFCRRHRHEPVKEQHAALKRRIEGHQNYFGVNGNIRSLALLNRAVERSWRYWLRRRSQRTRLSWKRFREGLLRALPLPPPRVRVQIWRTSP